VDSGAVRQAFLREATGQGLRVVRLLPDGRIVLVRDGTELTISLENLTRNVARDGNMTSIRRFVATIKSSTEKLPAWSIARTNVKFSAEPADHDFGTTLHRPVSDTVHRVLVYSGPDETRIRWIDSAQVAEWGVTPEEAWQVADRNMSELLVQTPISVEPIDAMKLGMFSSASVFKAAMVLSPNAKQVLGARVGWPLYVVMPCRDFVYFFPAKELIPRVGRTVVSEYKSSGYPITHDVLLLSDSGIKAVGTFPLE
jgi:hypothetical protein